MRFMRLLMLTSMIALCGLTQQALPVKSIENSGAFESFIREDMVIAHFYYKNKEKIDPDYEYTGDIFEGLEDRYTDLVRCIKINIEREHLSDLASDYRITKTPTFVLFSYGKEVDRMVVKNPGRLSVRELSNFITKNFEKDLKAKIKLLEEERKRREEERRRRRLYWNYYYGPYYYGPYDWYGHPGYWGGWRWGWGGYYGPYHHGYGRFGGRYYCR